MMFPMVHGILSAPTTLIDYHQLIKDYDATVLYDFAGGYGRFDQGTAGININSLYEDNIDDIGDGFPVLFEPSITDNVTATQIIQGLQTTFLVCFRSDDPQSSFVTLFGQGDNNSFQTFRFALNNSNAAIILKIDSIQTFAQDGFTDVIDGEWHTIIVTRDGSVEKLYVDGVFDEEEVCDAGTVAARQIELGFLRDSDGSASSNIPDLAVAAIMSSALTAGQVSELHGAIIASLDAAYNPSCVYPLDADESTIISAGYSGKLTPSENDTKGSRVILDGDPASNTTFVMANSGLLTGDPNAVFDFSVGKVGIEFEVLAGSFTPETGGLGDIVTQISCGLTTGLTNPVFFALNLLQDNNRVQIVGKEPSATTVYASGELPGNTNTTRVGLLIDNDLSAVRVWIDNVEVTLSDTTIPSGIDAVAPYLAIERFSQDDNGSAGVDQYARVYMSSSDWQTPFPAGTKDPCGHTV